MEKKNTQALVSSTYKDKVIEKAVHEIVTKEVNSHSYSSLKAKKRREQLLYRSYDHLFSDKDLTVFNQEDLINLLQNCSQAEYIRVFSLVIYFVEQKIIEDEKISRILSFKTRFTNSNPRLINDFTYLIHSDIYDKFISDEGVMNNSSEKIVSKLFFSSCDNLSLYDEEIRSLTYSWCESIKIDLSHTVSMRNSLLISYHAIAEKLFSCHGIDGLDRKELIEITEYKRLFLYLDFINEHHPLPKDLQYLCKFSTTLQSGRNRKQLFVELCSSENIFQFIVVPTSRGDRLFRLDIPVDTPLFSDMINFINVSPYRSAAFTDFIGNFHKSMGGLEITSAPELSYDAFVASIKYFSKSANEKSYFSFLFSFYNFLYDKYQINFFESKGLDVSILSMRGLCNKLNQGYEIVKYNLADEVPVSDKWIVLYNPQADTGTVHSSTKTLTMNFSEIHNKYFKEWAKIFFWKAEKSLSKKSDEAVILKEALNHVDDIRHHRALSFFCKGNNEDDHPLTINEISAIRYYFIHQDTAEKTKHTKIYTLRAFLVFLEENDVADVPAGAYYHLYYQYVHSNTAHAIVDDELKLLTQIIKHKSEASIMNNLFLIAYAISLDTPLRPSSIFSLKTDCVRETAKKGEFIIAVRQKDQTIEDTEEPITLLTKRLVDDAINITSSLRKKAPSYLKDELFIVPQKGSVPVRKLNRNNFAEYLKSCCQEAGISIYTPSNLRDTYMTKAKEFQIKNQLSNIELSILTGHKSPDVDVKHYMDLDIRTIMESMHGVIVGNVDISGQIMANISAEIATTENEVSNGCGYCNNRSCQELTYLDCIMCKHFVTMPSKLPFFDEQIKQMDVKIQNATTPHDKEDYVNIKRLLVAYEIALKGMDIK